MKKIKSLFKKKYTADSLKNSHKLGTSGFVININDENGLPTLSDDEYKEMTLIINYIEGRR